MSSSDRRANSGSADTGVGGDRIGGQDNCLSDDPADGEQELAEPCRKSCILIGPPGNWPR
jgi:hypothetical protein